MRQFNVVLLTLGFFSTLAFAQSNPTTAERQNAFALNCVMNSDSLETAPPICQISFSQMAPSVARYMGLNSKKLKKCEIAKDLKNQEYQFEFINDESTVYCLKKDVLDKMVRYTEIYRQPAMPTKKR